eukprot:TRINITY_DN42138_c0_g1_i1.p1 TRINITY_DN42138_c0_g1~~TRINITY_DN42138_c0_g1_i1.p1  ORF type:complete len:261 (-),score=32.87 TRINITY_DN42138_c0_g1_i1:85-867(-)
MSKRKAPEGDTEESFVPKVIVISGVTSGLGKALLRYYCSAGHKIYGCGRREHEVSKLRQTWPSADIRVLDVLDDGAVQKWVADIPGADIVVCNAGVSPESSQHVPVWKLPVQDFDQTIDVNVKGVMNMIRHFTPALIKAGSGAIVAVSSGLGRSSNPTHGAYCASKFAIEGLMKSLAQALPDPLVAVPLAPGVIATEMQKGEEDGDIDDWVKVAAPLILNLTREHNGASLSVPGFYTDKYKATWVIPDGAMPPKELGHKF